MALPSGLPDRVADTEVLARFLTASGQYSVEKQTAKPSALLPPRDGQTSVFRVTSLDEATVRDIGRQHVEGARAVQGVATFSAFGIRTAGLDTVADEPPHRHANLINWPVGADPELVKAQRKEIALAVLQVSGFTRWE